MELIPLWEGASQEAMLGHETFLPEITTAGQLRLIRNVQAPSLTVHTPDPSVATGTGVILCPGGSSFAGDDVGEGVVSSGLALYAAWHAAGHPAEMHVYATGGHRFAGAPPGPPSSSWTDRYLDWLGQAGFLG